MTVKATTAPVFTRLLITPTRILPNDRAMVNVAVTALASGDIGPDWEITGPLTLKVRAERDPRGNGRIYAIAVAATDDSGNIVTSTLHVVVAKSASTRFEDCDDQHRTEDQRYSDEKRDYDSRDQGERDGDDNADNDRKARGK